jgi:hypothetical protein
MKITRQGRNILNRDGADLIHNPLPMAMVCETLYGRAEEIGGYLRIHSEL